MADIIQTVPFTFNEIYQDLVTKIGIDSVYEGSNLAQLVTSMSYLVSMLNVNTAANINELMLPLAQKRENVLEGARLLGYEASHKKSYRYNITLTLTSTILIADKITIEKYSKFSNGANDYYYMGETTIEIYGDVGKVYAPFEVIEGDLKSFSNEPSLVQNIGTVLDKITNTDVPKTYIDIPFTEVEENGIEIFLDSSTEKWTKTKQFMIDKDTTFNKEFLRIDNIDFKTPRIFFKYAGIGNDVQAGTKVSANVLISKGSQGEATEDFVTTNTNLASKVSFSHALVSQGSEEESIESIQENAPLFFNTANRVITTLDYEVFCNRDTNIMSSQVWGGDEEYPTRPGDIWFSMTPATTVRNFTASEGNIAYTLDNADLRSNIFLEQAQIKSSTYGENGDVLNPGIWDLLQSYKIPTMKYFNRHPVYLNCDYIINVLKFDITKPRSMIYEGIFNTINNYFKMTQEKDNYGFNIEFIEKFKCEYFNSNLIKRIDNYLSDNSGFSLSMTNSVTIYDENLSKESFDPLFPMAPLNLANMDVFFQFEKPFEDIFDSVTGDLLTDRLPNITTNNVTIQGILGNITTDWSVVVGANDQEDIIEAPIKHGAFTIGKYTVHNGLRKNIIINLWVQDNTVDAIDHNATGNYLTTNLIRSEIIANPLKLNISFFSPNFKVYKNVIPRLHSVTFA
jgi:hypothetical protein